MARLVPANPAVSREKCAIRSKTPTGNSSAAREANRSPRHSRFGGTQDKTVLD
jgi:hypothetical protein